MRLHETSHGGISIAHEQLKKDYNDLLKSTTFSLQELFNPPDFNLNDYCKCYQCHPETNELVEEVQMFGERYGIWLPNAKHYVTSALFLFPSADFIRATALVKNLAVDYYLNDTCGRDVFRYLSFKDQLKAEATIQRITSLDEHLKIETNAEGIELANVEMLSELKGLSPISWFRTFLKYYLYHIDVTHKDCSIEGLGYVPSVHRYIAMRNHTSGMPHIIYCAEYSSGNFLNWNWLAEMKLASRMKALHRTTALFGSLSNDLFSFEKEVIDKSSDANLVMAIAINYRELKLVDVLMTAAGIVRKVLDDFLINFNEIKLIMNSYKFDQKNRIILETHLRTLQEIIQASWMWQVYTKRYKRRESIWKETQLNEEVLT